MLIAAYIATLLTLIALGGYVFFLSRQLKRAQDSRRFLENILDTIADPVFVKDKDHRMLWVNEAECQLAGKTRDDLLGKTDYDFFPPEQVDIFWRQDNIVFETGEENVNEESITSAEGVISTISTKKSRYVDPSGKQFLVGVIRDISDRKRAEEEVRKLNIELEARVIKRTAELAQAMKDLDEIIDAVADPLFVKDDQHRWLMVNKAFCDFLEVDRVALIGKSDFDFFSKSEAEDFWARDQAVLDTGFPALHEDLISNPSGTSRFISTKKTLLVDQKGEKRIVGVIRDLTERRRIEEQLRQAQKMECIGLLAGGIAHDFNNLLTPILGYSQLLQKGTLGTRELKMMREVENAAEHLKGLTRQLLAFGRRQMLDLRSINLKEAVLRFEPILRHAVRENIEIKLDFAPDLKHILVDPVQLEQVLLNLALNAQDAMPRGGTLSIEGRNATVDSSDVRFTRGLRPGTYSMLSIRDSGSGIDEETQRHLFEPFFTTKANGIGSGLGLAMVHGIISQHAGGILVNSEIGAGTTFEIYLPCTTESDGRSDLQADAPSREMVKGNGETILLLEDNATVRSTACKMLQQLNYSVIEADSARACFEAASRYEGRIDLFLTDVIMPDQNGKQMYERIAELKTNLKVLYMSGYAADIIVHQGIVDKDVHFIQKPLSLDSLSRKVREVLNS